MNEAVGVRVGLGVLVGRGVLVLQGVGPGDVRSGRGVLLGATGVL